MLGRRRADADRLYPQPAVGMGWAMRSDASAREDYETCTKLQLRTRAPCTCFGCFLDDRKEMQGCWAPFTAHVRLHERKK